MPGPSDPEMCSDATPDPDETPLPFRRKELWPIVTRAEELSRLVPNPRWKRAYADLAQAASVVDAFLARSTVQGEAPARK